MPRKPRNLEVGKMYHVMNRGVERRKIYLKNQDYYRFILGLEFFNRADILTKLWELIAQVGHKDSITARLLRERQLASNPLAELRAFALMPNHFHLIVREIQEGGIGELMKRLGGYSTYFNSQHDRVGSLFQSRYKSVEITSTEQMIATFVYVHTNPVELVEKGWKDFDVKDAKKAINGYRWSSYHDYVGEQRYPETIDKTQYLELLGGNQGCRKVVEEWIYGKAGTISKLSVAALE